MKFSKFYRCIPKFKKAGFKILHDNHDGIITLSKDSEVFEIEYDYFHKNFIEHKFSFTDFDYENFDENVKMIHNILYSLIF